jgi:beta-lactamase regulating signal transducer with metallopeptidase domain
MLNALWLSLIESAACLGLTMLLTRLPAASAATRAALWLAPAAVALVAFGTSLAAAARPAPLASAMHGALVAMPVIGPAPQGEAATRPAVANATADLAGDPRHGPAGTRSMQDWLHDHEPLIIAGWLAGVLLCSVRLAGSLVWLARLPRRCRPLGHDALPAAARALLAALPCRAALAECDELTAPVVLGLGQPVIAVPPGFLSATEPVDLVFVLAHEQAHLARRDAVTDLLVRAVEALFWFNPALPIARRRMAVERERACDERAARTCGRAAAARALWRTALNTGIAPPAVLGVGGAVSQLRARIAALMAPPRAQPASPAVLPAALAGLLVVTAGGAALASPGTAAGDLGHFEMLTPMTVARSDQVAVRLDDGRVLLAGGLAGSSETLAAAEVYDPSGRRFQPVAPMHVSRAGAAFARLPDGRVLVAGGWTGGVPTASAEIYDPARRTFRVIAPMAGPRASAITAVLPDGRILIAGGEAASQQTLRTAEIFDPALGRFERTGALRVPRTNAAAAPLLDGRILVAGGGDGSQALSSVEIYEPSQGRFRPAASLSSVREKPGAVTLADGRVLVVGGARDGSWRQQLASTEIYDPRTDRCTPGPDMSAARFKLGGQVVSLPSGRVLITGGDLHAEVFDPRTGQLATVPGDVGLARHYGTATLLTDGTVLITGGYGNDVRHTASALLYSPD